jgi:tetratricopeptide (TPR) repeat protein
MHAWPARAGAAAVVLGVYYWSLAVSPPVEPASTEVIAAAVPGRAVPSGAGVSVDEIRRLTEEADGLYRAGRYDAALAPLTELARRTPNNHIVIEHLATTYTHLERSREAAEAWEQYLQVSPTPKDACPALPRAYEAQGLIDKAFDAHARCYAIDPTDADLLLYFALACERRGETARARTLYEQGVALAPQYSDLLTGLARTSLRAGDVAAAERAATAAVKEAPTSVDALLVAGQVALRRDRPAEARALLTRALAQKEAYADLHLLMAMVARRDGQIAEAKREVARALELAPANREAQALRRALEEAK